MNEERKEEKEDESESRLEHLIRTNHEKMMQGFQAIESAFHILAGQIVALTEDLGSACGIISTDPFDFVRK